MQHARRNGIDVGDVDTIATVLGRREFCKRIQEASERQEGNLLDHIRVTKQSLFCGEGSRFKQKRFDPGWSEPACISRHVSQHEAAQKEVSMDSNHDRTRNGAEPWAEFREEEQRKDPVNSERNET